MRRLISIFIICIASSVCYATANLNTETGILLVPDVKVDGAIDLNSITLQLDTNNSTFKILDITTEFPSLSDSSLDAVTSDGLKIDFLGCARNSGAKIICRTAISRTDTVQDVFEEQVKPNVAEVRNPRKSIITDSLGQQYEAIASVYGMLEVGFLTINLIEGVTVEVDFHFDNFNNQATINSFSPIFFFDKTNKVVEATFTNVSL